MRTLAWRASAGERMPVPGTAYPGPWRRRGRQGWWQGRQRYRQHWPPSGLPPWSGWNCWNANSRASWRRPARPELMMSTTPKVPQPRRASARRRAGQPGPGLLGPDRRGDAAARPGQLRHLPGLCPVDSRRTPGCLASEHHLPVLRPSPLNTPTSLTAAVEDVRVKRGNE